MRRRASQFGLSSNNLSHNAILKKIASYIVLFSCTRAPKVLICPFTHVYTSISTSKDFLSNIDTLMSALGETQGSVFGPHPRYAHCTTNHPALPPDPQPHWSCEVCFFQNSCFHFIICKFVVLNCPRRKKIKALAFKKAQHYSFRPMEEIITMVNVLIVGLFALVFHVKSRHCAL